MENELGQITARFRDGEITAGEYHMRLLAIIAGTYTFYEIEKALFHIADCLDLRKRQSSGAFAHPYIARNNITE